MITLQTICHNPDGSISIGSISVDPTSPSNPKRQVIATVPELESQINNLTAVLVSANVLTITTATTALTQAGTASLA